MSRSMVNFLVDVTVASLFLAMLSVASVVHFIFPPGTQARAWSVWGLAYDDWSRVELLTVCLFAIGVLIHLALHWNWVCGFVTTKLLKQQGGRGGESARTLYGVAVLLIVLTILGAFFTAASFAATKHVDTTQKGQTLACRLTAPRGRSPIRRPASLAYGGGSGEPCGHRARADHE